MKYCEHIYDIVDLAWQTLRNEHGLILESTTIATCSLDQKIILWEINKEKPVKVYELKDAPTCIAFHPDLQNIFVSGNLDQTIRRYNIQDSSEDPVQEV